MKIYDLNDTPVDGNVGYVEMLERDVAKEVRRQQIQDNWFNATAVLVLGGGVLLAWVGYALRVFGGAA